MLLGALMVAYQPEAGGLVNRLLIPLAMAVATWMMVQNVAAVAIGTGVLAAIHSEPGSSDPLASVVYPALAAASGLVLALVFVRRFRRRIAETQEARWRHRRERHDEPGDRRS